MAPDSVTGGEGETRIERAAARVRAERECVAAEREAFERFRAAVASSASPVTAARSASNATVTGGPVASPGSLPGERTGNAGCRRVREAFADTVHDAVTSDAAATPLFETMREQLGREVATAVAAETTLSFTPEVERAVFSAVAERRRELKALDGALERERDSIDAAAETTTDIAAWLARADEASLSALGFDALRERHAVLADHRAACDRVVEQRQAALARSTNEDGVVGVTQRSLAASLYEEWDVDYPVLVTAARLDAVLEGCQRAVREHLVRRA